MTGPDGHEAVPVAVAMTVPVPVAPSILMTVVMPVPVLMSAAAGPPVVTPIAGVIVVVAGSGRSGHGSTLRDVAGPVTAVGSPLPSPR